MEARKPVFVWDAFEGNSPRKIDGGARKLDRHPTFPSSKNRHDYNLAFSNVTGVFLNIEYWILKIYILQGLPDSEHQCEGSPWKVAQEEPAEWSAAERLTPGQSGCLGALSLFLQRLYFLLFLQCLYLSLRAVRSAAFLFFVLHRFVLAASSACFFPFFLPSPNQQSTVSVRT